MHLHTGYYRLPKGIYKYQYIFCAWLFIWTILFSFGWVNVSPVISLIAASIVSSYLIWCTDFYSGVHWTKYLFVSVFEVALAVFFGVYPGGEKWSYRALSINLGVFITYLVYLHLNNLSFLSVYTRYLPRSHRRVPNETIVGYMQSALDS